MKFHRIHNTLRSIFTRYGLQITRHRYDLDSYFVTPQFEDRLLRKTADCLHEFLHDQVVFQLDTSIDTNALVREFYELYRSKPNKHYPGSMGFNSLLCLFAFTRHFKPGVIVESGVFVGQSTWALRTAAPGAVMESFDVDLSNLQYRDNTVRFHESDWSTFDFSQHDIRNAVCFFDDHVDHVRRLLECYERGFEYVLLDDNTPVEWLYLAQYGAPMFDFLFYEGFEDGEVIEWEMQGRRYWYKVNLEYLRRGRETVCCHAKFPVPMLSQLNGFSCGNPITVVRLKKQLPMR